MILYNVMKKTCNTCKKELPKNSNYFFVKKIKQKNAKREIKIYDSFRSDCKMCHAKKGEERRIVKRCKEMNCSIEDYKDNWKKQYSETRTIDVDAKEKLSKGQYNHYLKLKREGEIEDCQSYLKRVRINKKERNNRLRSEVLSKQKYFTKEDLKKAKRRYQRKNIENLTNATVANLYLGISVKDVPIEIIEQKRLIIKLKREIKTM